MSLDEWVESRLCLQMLKKNLEVNVDVMTDLDGVSQAELVRLNLIMVRQCLEQFSDELRKEADLMDCRRRRW